jgi:hypothetical protein
MNCKTIVVALSVVPLMVACSASSSPEIVVAADPTEKLPARFKITEPVPLPDFTEAANAEEFQQAIMEAAAMLGSQPQALRSPGEGKELAGGVSFAVPARKLEAILRDAHERFLAKGFYLFRYDQNFNIDSRPDKVGLLPTSDKYAVMAAMETNGDNYNIGTAGVIGWMKEMEQEQPFILTGIGFDYMEGHFTSPVRDARSMADRMYVFCPDIVDQGVGDLNKLAAELKSGKVYFWWD